MKLLLDTHALLWWLDDDERLQTVARQSISDPGNDVLVSVVSLWEVVVKVRIEKLEAEIADILKAVERDGFTLLTISPAHLRTLDRLPFHEDHRDPFDHLLVAQAITERATFLSEDRNVPRYAVPLFKCSDRPSSAIPG